MSSQLSLSKNSMYDGGKLEGELPFDKKHTIRRHVRLIVYLNRGRNIVFNMAKNNIS